MAMFGAKSKPWYETLPKPSAADMADYQEVLRRAGSPEMGGPAAAPPPMAPTQMASAMPAGMFGATPQLPTNIAGNVPKPSPFAEGGIGRNIIGAIGDGLAVAGGGRPTFLPMQMQKRQEAREDARFSQQLQMQEARLNKPQAVNLGNGGVATWTPDGGLEVLREPEASDPAEPAAVRILRAAGVEEGSPEWSRALIMSLAGYDNSPEALKARVDTAGAVAEAQAAARARYREPSTGGSSGGRKPLTSNERARYQSEAAAAISRGADPAKVKARLRELGAE